MDIGDIRNTHFHKSQKYNANIDDDVNHLSTEAKANILGPVDLYVKTGSLLTLTCILSQGPHDLGTIFWYKGE